MKIELKFLFFRNYWWLLIVAFVGICIGVVVLQSNVDMKLLAALFGTLLSVLYFLQKQRLEETRLFREIFAECNERYDKINEGLNAIVDGPDDRPLEPAERVLLNDYFNLCGEEYLYYTQGYIFPQVWQAWYNGMIYFTKNRRIAAVWSEEKKSDSYYGLSF